LRELLDRFVAEGFSKFVLVPVAQPADWTAELELLAAEILPMAQVSA
jgi:hypothetical protein